MKEDILEQLVEDWFISKSGRFIKHNVKYRPDQSKIIFNDKNKYSVHSDIDLIGIDLFAENDSDKAIVVNCKSWQAGADLKKWLKIIKEGLLEKQKNEKYNIDVKYWKKFREFIDPIWTEAFVNKIFLETGEKSFTYIFAVTKIKKDIVQEFINNNLLTQNFKKFGFNVKIKVIDIRTIFNEVFLRMDEKEVLVTPETTNLGRIIQLFRASGILSSNIQNKPV